MQSKSELVIPYLGLANGLHNYIYIVDQHFWKGFETSKISEGQMEVDIIFDKLDGLVTLSIECNGAYKAKCDRCVAEIMIPMQFEDTIIIKIQEASGEETEVTFMDPKTSHIDLAPLIYESIHVHMPIISLKNCEEDDYKGCDQEILDRLYGSDEEKNKSPSGIWKELDNLNLN
ncbi:MAG: hypothetical protein ACJA01_002748 [Saprospiraceae bacterium]|jgi:uncharacterized protein